MGLDNAKQAQNPVVRDKRQKTIWDVTRLLGTHVYTASWDL